MIMSVICAAPALADGESSSVVLLYIISRLGSEELVKFGCISLSKKNVAVFYERQRFDGGLRSLRICFPLREIKHLAQKTKRLKRNFASDPGASQVFETQTSAE